jgi:hypothetical protein
MHKYKLERKTLKNYEAVLDDLRKELSMSKTLQRANQSSKKLILESSVMLKKLSVLRAPKEKLEEHF